MNPKKILVLLFSASLFALQVKAQMGTQIQMPLLSEITQPPAQSGHIPPIPMAQMAVPEQIPVALPSVKPLDQGQIQTQPQQESHRSKHKKEKALKKAKRNKPEKQAPKATVASAIKTPESMADDPTRLDFEVKNTTGKTVYAVCFAYIHRRPFTHWRWEKSDIYKIEDDKKAVIHLDMINDEQDRDNTFGYLGVFDTEEEAEQSTFELLPDRRKLDLDKLIDLKGKTVTLTVEKYGFKKEFFEYDFVEKKRNQARSRQNLVS